MVLVADNISKSFTSGASRAEVLRGVSLSVEAGESVALTGESGSGKSTLLHLCAGLDVPDAGDVTVQGRALARLSDAARARVRRDKIGLVFQQFNLIPSLTVGRNLSFQARLSGREGSIKVEALAERLGLAELLSRYPEELSGGQQQRVAIGRALAAAPSLILADEPTGSLDEETGDRVMDLLLELVTESGAALLMVTHSERLAARLSRRVHLHAGLLE